MRSKLEKVGELTESTVKEAELILKDIDAAVFGKATVKKFHISELDSLVGKGGKVKADVANIWVVFRSSKFNSFVGKTIKEFRNGGKLKTFLSQQTYAKSTAAINKLTQIKGAAKSMSHDTTAFANFIRDAVLETKESLFAADGQIQLLKKAVELQQITEKSLRIVKDHFSKADSINLFVRLRNHGVTALAKETKSMFESSVKEFQTKLTPQVSAKISGVLKECPSFSETINIAKSSQFIPTMNDFLIKTNQAFIAFLLLFNIRPGLTRTWLKGKSVQKGHKKLGRKFPAVLAIILVLVFIGAFFFFPFGEGDAEARKKNPFVDVTTKGILCDAVYATSRNFVGEVLDGYKAQKCMVLPYTLKKLVKVNAKLKLQGYQLLIKDGYRPKSASRHMTRWASVTKTRKNKLLGPYIASASKHNKGVATDLTLATLGPDVMEVWMGSIFDDFYDTKTDTILTWCHYGDVRAATKADVPFSYGGQGFAGNIAPKAARSLLRSEMRKQGFGSYSKEWWHFQISKSKALSYYANFPIE